MPVEWYGVFSPKGELEAVEHSADLANNAAASLSPNRNQPNRTVRPVVVLADEINLLEVFANAALAVYHNRANIAATATEKLQRELHSASLAKQPVSGDYWHDAHRKRQVSDASHRLLSALAELYINQPKEPLL